MELAVFEFLLDEGPEFVDEDKGSILTGLILEISKEDEVLPLPKRSIHELAHFLIVLVQGKSVIDLRN